MNLDDITPLILTYNEAPNIRRCLDRLKWAKEIVVVDSFSTDETIELSRAYPQVRVFERHFDTHMQQWNYGLKETDIKTDWVLELDADYRVPDNLIEEMRAIEPPANISAYRVPFIYSVFGRALRGNVYPPIAALFRRNACEFVQDGHTQRLHVNVGDVGFMKSAMIHDDRKPLSRWLVSQSKYMELEAEKLLRISNNECNCGDRLRKMMVVAPPVMLAYCLFIKRGILDGWPGWYYAFQRMAAETILSLKLIEKRTLPLKKKQKADVNDGEQESAN